MDGTQLDDDVEPEIVLGGRGALAAADLPDERALLDAVTRALGLYVRDRSPRDLFEALLADLLALTGSGYGYIAEVLHDDAGAPYLRTWAVTDISWDEETKALYDTFAVHGGGLEFRNLATLFGWGLLDGGRLVVANDPGSDPRAAGIPVGHPPLDCFLGVPLFRSGEMVGQFGVANRPGGYDAELVERLAPFTEAVASIVEGHRVDRERREAQERLGESEQRLNSILSHTSGIVTVLLPDGTWVSSSDEAIRSLGYPPHLEPEGGIFSLLHPDDVPMALAALDQVVAGTRTQEQPIELRVADVDGNYHVLETRGQDLRHDPAVGGILVTSHDITARKVTEEQLRGTTSELHALVGTLGDGVLFVDDERRVVFANDAFGELWGFDVPATELVGRITTEHLRAGPEKHLEDPEEFFSGVAQRYADHVHVMGEIIHFRDGRVIERDYLPVDFEAGENHGHLWLYRDITERSRMEAERQQVLDAEREMRLAIEEQNRALLEIDELKNEFVATVSHELRTPLTSIVSFAELLREEGDALGEDGREFLEIIDRNAERLLHLVGDLLLVANIDSGTLLVEPAAVELGRVVEQAVTDVSAQAELSHVALSLTLDPDPAPVVLDERRFGQVLANLLSNAVKFTPAGGSVTVATRRDHAAWVIEVADTGIGIPEDELDRLFERFFRASNARTEQQPGSGLGLVIARSIVDLHGGTLELANRPDGGIVVTATLPDGGFRARVD